MESLTQTLHRINESLEIIRRCRPGWREQYMMEPCLTEEELLAFEEKHGCRLPEEYREFLRLTGSAGAGPDYGLFAPQQHFPNSGFEDCLQEDVDLSRPFPHTEAWNDVPSEWPEEWTQHDYFSPRHACGSVLIGDRGCALWIRLVITGPCAGEIWNDDRTDTGGLSPALAPDGSRYTFLRWFLDWLDIVFYCYGHEGPMRQLRAEDAAKAKAIGAHAGWVP